MNCPSMDTESPGSVNGSRWLNAGGRGSVRLGGYHEHQQSGPDFSIQL